MLRLLWDLPQSRQQQTQPLLNMHFVLNMKLVLPSLEADLALEADLMLEEDCSTLHTYHAPLRATHAICTQIESILFWTFEFSPLFLP